MKIAHIGTSFALIRRMTVIAQDIVCLELSPTRTDAFQPFTAGAHIDVFVNGDVIRQYSLSNDPADSSIYRLAIQKDPQSRGGSAAIHATFQAGDVIRIGVPRNNFELAEDDTHVVLVAGGIGITPILSMAYRLSAKGTSFALHLCARSIERAAFIDEIASSSFASKLHLHLDDGGPEQRFDPTKAFSSVTQKSAVYVCGPRGFMDFVTEAARRGGVDPDRIHTESFSAALVRGEDEFEVIAARSGKVLLVKHDKSIAETLEEAGLRPLLSCEQGICGTCLTRVISGEVDHRDTFQTAQEKCAGNQIAICCSRAKSTQLVLDI
ncbi:PDR/VanB family oxidoreductase [Aminobacter aganoensis]|uniref:Vanillate O-demethylase ferredoxin subunit n=2 Tax=Aminobacter aganoensis TaxID=83264 RepID=A0A7X0KP76_9HYPH|nr:PDR/VanB family oxidoreductase [Aminobacter aganoensis]MBB6357869.1 vanillate O-demethylase ferredoxin subunit [Aminobacter aganoensis]